jgi:hypothetical protein
MVGKADRSNQFRVRLGDKRGSLSNRLAPCRRQYPAALATRNENQY